MAETRPPVTIIRCSWIEPNNSEPLLETTYDLSLCLLLSPLSSLSKVMERQFYIRKVVTLTKATTIIIEGSAAVVPKTVTFDVFLMQW